MHLFFSYTFLKGFGYASGSSFLENISEYPSIEDMTSSVVLSYPDAKGIVIMSFVKLTEIEYRSLLGEK